MRIYATGETLASDRRRVREGRAGLRGVLSDLPLRALWGEQAEKAERDWL